MKELEKVLSVKDLERFYDTLATKVGPNWQKSMYRAPHQIARFEATVEYLSTVFTKDSRVLELGSANGSMTARLAPLVKHIDSVEISSVAISNSPVIENVTYIHDEVINFLENTENTYDAVIATEVLEHVLDFKKAIDLCFKAGKLVLVSMPISEPLNEEGAFNPDLVEHETRQGDATGHLRMITPEELRSYFSTVTFYWNNNISVIVAGY